MWERLHDDGARVLVVGEFKQGKSSLVNALLNVATCPVDDDIATSVPTLLRFAEQPEATAWYEDPDAGEPRGEPADPDRLAELVSEAGNRENHRGIRSVEVGLPRRLLARGLTLVDTPGVGGLGSVHGALSIASLPAADAVVFVSDASQEYSEPELRFLRHAAELCPEVVCVLTKTDLYPAWRVIAELDQGHLQRHGFDLPLIPLSAALRAHGLAAGDAALNEESGFPRLVDHLQRRIVDRRLAVSVEAVAAHTAAVAAQLEAQLELERRALDDPEEAARLHTEMVTLHRRSDELKAAAARWQTTLNDGIADLGADLDHELRSRLRRRMEEAERRIEESDPAEGCEELDGWLRRSIAEDVLECYTLLARRTDDLAAAVAELFAAAEADLGVTVDVAAPVDLLTAATSAGLGTAAPTTGARGRLLAAASGGFTAVRGSYGGFMMFQMIGGLVGLGALSPVVIGLTAAMGRKTVREERQRQLAQRRQQAKAAARKYADEIGFQVGKDSRDALRHVHRALRDGFLERVQEIQQSALQGLQRAQQALEAEAQDRQRRLADVEAELARVRELAGRASGLRA